MSTARLILIVVPLVLIPTMAAAFPACVSRWGFRRGYFAAFCIYWFVWCLAIPWSASVERSSACSQSDTTAFRKPGRPRDAGAGGAAVPRLRLCLSKADRQADAAVVLLSAGIAAVNAPLEELLWRGAYLGVFPDDWLLGYVYPSKSDSPSGTWHRCGSRPIERLGGRGPSSSSRDWSAACGVGWPGRAGQFCGPRLRTSCSTFQVSARASTCAGRGVERDERGRTGRARHGRESWAGLRDRSPAARERPCRRAGRPGRRGARTRTPNPGRRRAAAARSPCRWTSRVPRRSPLRSAPSSSKSVPSTSSSTTRQCCSARPTACSPFRQTTTGRPSKRICSARLKSAARSCRRWRAPATAASSTCPRAPDSSPTMSLVCARLFDVEGRPQRVHADSGGHLSSSSGVLANVVGSRLGAHGHGRPVGAAVAAAGRGHDRVAGDAAGRRAGRGNVPRPPGRSSGRRRWLNCGRVSSGGDAGRS